ncbi:tetratricopeptide repeat protein [Streptomyces sp. NRRL B-24484]|uniref:tetratricopeptide repeat protein n=1 Tax=Streptomyces sp. NRRL B-24484 TaxID=1463833 RepID=UPI00069387FB|nr:tetratricopeptide repeat protein [Streptomyces sp. NRRL B-24484]
MARKTATIDERSAGPGAAAPADGLPPGPAAFAGRRTELAALNAAARAGGRGAGRARLVVLAGRPGSGRTALALRWARSVASQYPGGVLYARLSAPDGSRVPPGRTARRLLEHLGAVPAGLLPPEGPDGDDPACAALREVLADREALLLLDDAKDADQLRPLLGAGPGVLLLATTGGPLTGIGDVDPVIIGGLDQAAAVGLLGDLVGGTRVSCDPVGAADLADACACRPAALRLTAVRLRADARAAVTDAAADLTAATGRTAVAEPPPAGAAEGGAAKDARNGPGKGGRRADRSEGEGGEGRRARDLLPADGPVPVPGGDPLGRAFELLYRTLTPARARMLRMLTLAPAQLADLRTASALVGCPAPEAAGLLADLAERELLTVEPPAADGTARYRVPGWMHPRLVELRAEADRPAEIELARARLLERLVRLVDSAQALLAPAAGPAPDPLPGPLRLRTADQAARWLDEERDQLLTAVGDAIGQGDLDGSAGRLVSALLRALPRTPATVPADLHRLHELVLEVAERAGAPRRAAAALLNLGDLQAAAGRWGRAAERYRAALDRARAAGDEAGCARALESAGGCYRALGDPVRAGDSYGRALALRQESGDAAAEARLLARVAEAHTAQRRFEEALREYRAAFGIFRRLGDEHGTALVAQALDRLQQQLTGEWIHPIAE